MCGIGGARARNMQRKKGQTILLLVMMVVALVIFLVIAFDIFLGTRGKRHAINAGDAAALAGAAAQGRALNRIGELNLDRLAIACEYSEEDMWADPTLRETRDRRIEEIVHEQKRIALMWPMDGFREAQRLARKNLAAGGEEATIITDSGAERLLREELKCWMDGSDIDNEYRMALQSAVSSGIVAMDQNAKLRCDSITGHHWYYEQSFYNCLRQFLSNKSDGGILRWFCRWMGGSESAHARSISVCSSWSPPNPDEITEHVTASGLFDVNVHPVRVCFTNDVSENAGDVLLEAWEAYRGGGEVTKEKILASGVLGDMTHPWYFYGLDWLGRWNAMRGDGTEKDPLVGRLKEEYDVPGAMAAVRVVANIKMPSAPERETAFPWTASAKPFGALWDGRRVTDLFGEWSGGDENLPLVLPSFTTTRLFKYNASRQPQTGGSARPNVPSTAWVAHKKHVAEGKRDGGCGYCALLKQWESGLAAEVATWLRQHPHDEFCDPPGKGGQSYDDDDGNN